MDWNGERQKGTTLEEIEPKHVERYRVAAPWVENNRVLDAACGCGYGSHILRKEGFAKEVVGVDYSKEAIEYAKQHWWLPGITFWAHNLTKPLKKFGEFDVVVSFETIEHIPQPIEETLTKFAAVLVPNGLLILSHPINETTKSQWHVHYCITPKMIIEMLERLGFSIMGSGEQPRRGTSFDYHIVLAVKK